ncbi:MAG: hypothetical protein NXI32_10675 [bacterium]|nr:hypothetical protein [bacterium]
MPLHGERLDELLSGYLDNQLSSEESRQVEQELEREESVRTRLTELRQTSRLLKEHFASESQLQPRLSKGFSSRVMAISEAAKAARAEAEQAANANSATEPDREQIIPAAASTVRSWSRPVFALVALAASILLLLSLSGLLSDSLKTDRPSGSELATQPPQGSSPDLQEAEGANPFDSASGLAQTPKDQTEVQTQPEDASAADQQPVEYVSQLGFGMTYLLVVDVEMTQTAAQQNVLQRILAQAGIAENSPILGDERVEEAIAESRMTVTEANGQAAQNAEIYFLRASIDDLGAALDQIYADQMNFPRVALDLAFDGPDTRLMRTIARSTGKRFAVNEKFAAPLSINTPNGRDTSISGLKRPTRYVSSEARSQGFGSLPPPSVEGSSSLETMLLIVRTTKD